MYLFSDAVFTSPNFPNYYPHNYDHTWNMSVEFGSVHVRVKTFVLEFSTNCSRDDWVKVRRLNTFNI